MTLATLSRRCLAGKANEYCCDRPGEGQLGNHDHRCRIHLDIVKIGFRMLCSLLVGGSARKKAPNLQSYRSTGQWLQSHLEPH